jgi:hypothetical protein
VEEEEFVGEGGGEVEVVAGGEDGELAVAGEAAEELPELGLVLEVEEGVRLVEEEGPGFLGEGAAEEGALALAAGELFHRGVEEGGEVEEGGGFADDVEVAGGFDAERAEVGGAAGAEDAGDGLAGLVGGGLGEVGDDAGEVAEAVGGEGLVEPLDGAGGGAELAEEEAEERGLAGAVGAEEDGDVACVDGEGEVAEDGVFRAVGEGEVVGVEGHGFLSR